MQMNVLCEECLYRKYANKYPKETPFEVKREYLDKIQTVICERGELTAPEVVEKIEDVYREFFGEELGFAAVKSHFNELMLGLERAMESSVVVSDAPVKRALSLAMAGNFIDFGAMDSVDEDKLRDFLDTADVISVNDRVISILTDELGRGKSLVYLLDNCGEIVADKVLMRQIKRVNPNIQITAVVRGAPVLNDVTHSDASQVGLSEVADLVIDNGCSIAGNVLSRVSEQAREAIESADVIISKGQGNFESLYGCRLNVYYIFMCKCELFATRFGVPKFSGMLIRQRDERSTES